MNILLYKFHSYLSRQPESSQLNRVIVVEEAHEAPVAGDVVKVYGLGHLLAPQIEMAVHL